MTHLKRHVNEAAHHSDKADNDVSEDVGSVVHAVADRAGTAAHQVHETAGRFVEALEDKCDRVGQSFQHGRENGRRWQREFVGAVRSRPLVSLLIAAGTGAVVGILWDRRRH